jgi:hypothetical protein
VVLQGSVGSFGGRLAACNVMAAPSRHVFVSKLPTARLNEITAFFER